MTDKFDQRPGVKLTPAQEKSRRARNMAIGIAITLFAIMFYVVTIVKLGPAAISGPM